MPRTEIDETELQNYRNVTDALKGMLSNPAARRLVLQAQKLANPNAVIPEIDAAAPVMAAVGEVSKKVDDFIARSEKSNADREEKDRVNALSQRWDSGRVLAKKEGYTDDGLKKLEDFMQENGIADHEMAIPAFERKNPPQSSAVTSSNHIPFFAPENRGSEDMKMLMEGNDEGFLNKKIHETLTDIRSVR